MAGKPDHIAGSLIKDILYGRYRVQDRLPSERDLSARFDANRGAVREAMKKLEQIGLADVQPGGARVKDSSEASLDVIGHMLSQGALPDVLLVDQILVVINGLISVAAEQTLEVATAEEIDNIRRLSKPLFTIELDDEAHTLARFELMQAIMLASKNLPLQIIARSLFEQFAPKFGPVSAYADINRTAYAMFAKQLDQALASKDLPALRASFEGLSKLNRETMMRAFEAASSTGQEAIHP